LRSGWPAFNRASVSGLSGTGTCVAAIPSPSGCGTPNSGAQLDFRNGTSKDSIRIRQREETRCKPGGTAGRRLGRTRSGRPEEILVLWKCATSTRRIQMCRQRPKQNALLATFLPVYLRQPSIGHGGCGWIWRGVSILWATIVQEDPFLHTSWCCSRTVLVTGADDLALRSWIRSRILLGLLRLGEAGTEAEPGVH